MKFIHLANVRLGRQVEDPFPGTDPEREQWEDLQNAVNTCKEQGCDFLFITGNLFDGTPSVGELEKADELFSALKEGQVLYLPGDRDKGAADVPYQWKSHTALVSGTEVQRMVYPKLQTEITACPFSEDPKKAADARSLERGRKGAVQILLAPSLAKEDTKEVLDSCLLPFDYCGIGTPFLYKGSGQNRIFSPGNFFASDFSDENSHGFFLCTLLPGKKQSAGFTRQFVSAVKREYVSLKAEISEEQGLETVSGRLQGTINKAGSDNIYEIVLEGAMSPEVFLHKDRFYSLGLVKKIDDRTDIIRNAEALKTCREDEAVARFASALFKSPADPIHMKALSFGLEALREDSEA